MAQRKDLSAQFAQSMNLDAATSTPRSDTSLDRTHVQEHPRGTTHPPITDADTLALKYRSTKKRIADCAVAIQIYLTRKEQIHAEAKKHKGNWREPEFMQCMGDIIEIEADIEKEFEIMQDALGDLHNAEFEAPMEARAEAEKTKAGKTEEGRDTAKETAGAQGDGMDMD
jgi:hypothetical protein